MLNNTFRKMWLDAMVKNTGDMFEAMFREYATFINHPAYDGYAKTENKFFDTFGHTENRVDRSFKTLAYVVRMVNRKYGW